MWRVTDLVVSLCELLGDKRALPISYKLTVCAAGEIRVCCSVSSVRRLGCAS